MTKEDKKARRRLRHNVQAEARRHAIKRMGLFARDAQLDAAAKLMADRLFAFTRHVPTQVKPLEPIS